jgi:GNAT superfamily N-acetyltransferase
MFKEPESQARTSEFFADALSRDDSAVFIADADGIVGIAHGRTRAAPDVPVLHAQRWGVLESLVVAPAWRRRGVGKRLADAFEGWALGEGASWVEASVYEFNGEARGFYEALGYLTLRTIVWKPRDGKA